MSYFLIVYDRKSGTVKRLQEFPEDEGRAALTERFRIESQNTNGNDLEVVVLGADSLETIQKTHSRYFKTAAELAGSAS